MKKRLSLLLALAMALSLLAGCGQKDPGNGSGSGDNSNNGDPPVTNVGDINQGQDVQIDNTKTYKKSFAIANYNDVVQIDPQLANGTGVDVIYKLTHNELVSFDLTTNTTSPELAESWEAESPSSFVFHLRRGVKFSNGEEFTADDVLYTFAERPGIVTGTTGTAVWGEIDEIEVIDAYTVRFKLTQDDADFLNRLYLKSYALLNREACEANQVTGPMVGTGGWIIDSWAPGEHVKVTRFDDSWVWEKNGLTPTEEMDLVFRSEDTTRAVGLQNGEFAATGMIASADAPALTADPNVNVLTFEAETLYYGIFNMQSGPFANDPNLRKAVACAINYADVIEVQTDGYGTRAYSMWGKNQYALYENFEEQYEYNLEKAREYLAKSNHPNGLTFTWVLGSETLGAVLQQNLAAIGLEVNIQISDLAGMNVLAKSGDFDVMSASISLQAIGDRFAFVPNINHNTNRASYDNPEMMAMFKAALAETDDAARHAIYQDIQEEIHDVLPYLPLYYGTRTVAWYNGVSGIQWSPDSKPDYTYTVWEE